jgi:hypothetical protein
LRQKPKIDANIHKTKAQLLNMDSDEIIEEDTLYNINYLNQKLIVSFFICIKIMYRGMNITSGSCTLIKDETNLVGISIGGGAPFCPCVYIVQIFDKTPAAREGSLAAGN